MKKGTRFVGLDVHADTIAVAVADGDGPVDALGTIPNRPESVRKLMKKLGPASALRVCYEAGPCGYALYWQFVELGVRCEVIAPTLVPVRAGDRVKTDRRDAIKLARSYRSGDLTAVWVPDRAHEALRDLVRAREAAKKDEHRVRRRLTQFLLRNGHRVPTGMTTWRARHLAWMRSIELAEPAQKATMLDYLNEVEHHAARIRRLDQALDDAIEAAPAATRDVVAALQALRGVGKVVAVTVVAEVGRLSRFPRPKQLMSYAGAVPREHSSGSSIRRGSITKTGNAHLRRVLVEAAWSYRSPPRIFGALGKRQVGLSEEVKEIAWKAQHRLNRRYHRLLAKGKPKPRAITAVARELLGFIWAIGASVERAQERSA